jgi:phage-related protein
MNQSLLSAFWSDRPMSTPSQQTSFDGIFQEFLGTVGAFTNALQEIASVPKEVADEFRQWGQSLKAANNAIATFVSSPQQLGSSLVSLAGKVVDTTGHFSALQKAVSFLPDGITSSVKSLGDVPGQVAGQFRDWGKALAPAKSAIASLIPSPKQLSGGFISLAHAVAMFETALAPSTMISVLGVFAKAAGQGITTLAQAAGSRLVNAVSNVLTPAVNAAGSAISGVNRVLTPALDGISTAAQTVGQGLAIMAAPIVNEFKVLGSAIASVANSTPSSLR